MEQEPLSDAERSLLIEELERTHVGRGLTDEFDHEFTLTSPTCGDEITVRIGVANGAIAAFSWDGHGCTVSQAAASALASILPLPVAGFRDLADAYFRSVADDGKPDASFGDAEVFAGIGRFPLRARCASLAWRATLAALD